MFFFLHFVNCLHDKYNINVNHVRATTVICVTDLLLLLCFGVPPMYLLVEDTENGILFKIMACTWDGWGGVFRLVPSLSTLARGHIAPMRSRSRAHLRERRSSSQSRTQCLYKSVAALVAGLFIVNFNRYRTALRISPKTPFCRKLTNRFP